MSDYQSNLDDQSIQLRQGRNNTIDNDNDVINKYGMNFNRSVNENSGGLNAQQSGGKNYTFDHI